MGTDTQRTETDGGQSVAEADSAAPTDAATAHRQTNYLEQEVNLLRPSTTFMRDHLRVVWTGFVVWAIIVFGPVTATVIAPDAMTTTMPVLGFPLHYFLVAIGAPTGALLLSVWYARKRDALDEKYGIDHTTAAETGEGSGDVAVADGGDSE
jgi:putative solute:sodium symporter small subunit